MQSIDFLKSNTNCIKNDAPAVAAAEPLNADGISSREIEWLVELPRDSLRS